MSTITDRKPGEQFQHNDDQLYRVLLESSPDPIVIYDLQGLAVYINLAFTRVFGWTSEDVLGKRIDFVPPESVPETVAGIKQMLATGRVDIFDTKRYTKDGKVLNIQLTASTVNDKDGKPVSSIVCLRDITIQKRAEEELQEAKESAEQANRAKSVFLANMSHELRTPLNAILGFAQIMERDPLLPERQREHLHIITHSGEHLLGLINDVLEMSKIEAGRITLNLGTFNLHGLLDSLDEMFQLRAEAKHLQLLFELSPDLPEYVATDEGKLRQILINLLGNAIKFTSEGGVALRAGFIETDSVSRLMFEVEDTGEGIAEGELPNLFQSFAQTHSGVKANEGTGLGLTISRQFVRLMGGDMTVSSTLGKGTICKFDLQYTVADAQEIRNSQIDQRVIGIDPSDTTEYRILVVDDKWENRRLLVEWLKDVGIQVREAENGRDAVQVWEEWAPQLIWMDMRMPVMDGYEATRRIKLSTKGQATAVLALTASAFEHERAAITAAGCDDFVSKPVRSNQIFEKMAEHLGIKFVYETTQSTNREETSADEPITLAALPNQWIVTLQQAAESIDVEAANMVIDWIRANNPALADTLADLVANYRFDKLQTLLQEGVQNK